MYHSPITDIMKGVALGMMAGIAVGCCGRKMYDENPKLKKKASKAIHTICSDKKSAVSFLSDAADFQCWINYGSVNFLYFLADNLALAKISMSVQNLN